MTKKNNHSPQQQPTEIAPPITAEAPPPSDAATTAAPKRRRRFLIWILRLCGIVFLLLLIAIPAFLCVWYWMLPGILTEQLFPELRSRFGLDGMTLGIRRIGWSGADFENLQLTDDAGGVLAIDSIRVDYQPYRPGNADPTAAWLTITDLTLSGLECSVKVEGGVTEISGFRLRKVLDAFARLGATEDPAPAAAEPASGRPVAVLKKLVLRNLMLKLDFEGRRLALPVNAVLSSDDPAWQQLSAEIEIAPRGQMLKWNAEFDRVAGTLSLRTRCDNFRLDPLNDLLSLPGGAASGEVTATIHDLNGDPAGTIEMEMAFTPPENLIAGSKFAAPIRLHQTLDFEYRKAEGQLALAGTGNLELPQCTFLEEQVQLRNLDHPTWNFALTFGKDGLLIRNAEGSVEKIEIDAFGTRLLLPEIRLTHIGDNRFQLTGSGAELTAPAQNVRLENIRFSVPLPLTDARVADFGVEHIRLAQWELGSINGNFDGTPEKFTLSGDFHSPLFAGARLDFRGEFQPDAGGETPAFLFEADLPTYAPKQPIQLGDWVPALKGAECSGALTLGAALRLENGKLSSGLQLFLQDGAFRWTESNVEADGIELDLRVEDLFTGKTPPGQQLKIKRLNAANLEFTDLEMKFRTESLSMLNIEQASLKWCGGELFLRPITIYTNQKSWSPILECESLNLAEFLRQTGVVPATTRGDGVVYGKLPLRISPRGIFFEPAYLYSRPGENNFIRVAEPEKLAAGIGGAALQQTQLEFAGEALRDFNYNWVKVNFNTESGDLVLSLQFDGKPAGPLPFAYDDETGQLRRDPAGRATFEGIQLNINTRVPLNLLLNLNRRLQQLMEK